MVDARQLSPAKRIARELRRWLDARPIAVRADTTPVGSDEGGLQFFQTGPDLIARVVRAIELDQSVLLSGPRGCGKSYCVRKAIEEAQARGIIPPGASVFLQGNREIPRDYLVEDEITFRLLKTNGKAEVVPDKRSAPLFRFVRRDDNREPVVGAGRRVQMDFGGVSGSRADSDHDTNGRFVLFLDEINRFSDGILDSLLSVLEERTAVLAGQEYRLPVVVCMTMNPPGYDSSARRLSPPLAARIGRSYRLYSPDIDTLTDNIVRARLDELRRRYASTGGTAFPDVSPELQRRVALLTLCLWGDVTTEKPGNEYLTPRTRDMLRALMAAEPELRSAMSTMSQLCHFGPDGRAAGDWLATAIGRVFDQAVAAGQSKAQLGALALRETAVESVAHKIYDSFSPASRPDLTRAKERAIVAATRVVLESEHRVLCQFVRRRVDDLDRLQADFGAALWGQDSVDSPERALQARDVLLRAGLTSDADLTPWIAVAQSAQADGDLAAFLEALQAGQFARPLLVSAEAENGLIAGYSSESLDGLARSLEGRTDWNGPLPRRLRQVRPILGPVRRTLRAELGEYALVRDTGVDSFLSLCELNGLLPGQVRAAARTAQRIWLTEFPGGRPFAALEDAEREAYAAAAIEALGGSPAANLRDCFAVRILPRMAEEAMHRRGREAFDFAEFLQAIRHRIPQG